MKPVYKNLGKVRPTVDKDNWSIDKEYDLLTIVYDPSSNKSYVSRKDVPANIVIDNREYWLPFGVGRFVDNAIININYLDGVSQELVTYTLEEAIARIGDEDKRLGVIISFYGNEASDSHTPGWCLYQFMSNDLNDWDNVNAWNSIYYNRNKNVGWFRTEAELLTIYPYPHKGDYCYVGTSLISSYVYRCYENGTWTNTQELASTNIGITIGGNIRISENGTWIVDNEDTGIKAVGTGIDKMTYTPSQEDGGTNVLQVKLTDGTQFSFPIKNGNQGNSGIVVPDLETFLAELVNNLTTDDATKGLSAAQGVVLDNKISQLGQKITCSVESFGNKGIYTAQYFNNIFIDNYLFQGTGIVYTASSTAIWQGIIFTINNPIIGKTIHINADRIGGIGNKYIKLAWFDSVGTIHENTFFSGNSVDYVIPDSAVKFEIVLSYGWDSGAIAVGDSCTFNNVDIYYTADIVDNLTSEDATVALAASMGKKLKSLIDRTAIMIIPNDIVLDVSTWQITLPKDTIIRFDSYKYTYQLPSTITFTAINGANTNIIIFDRDAKTFSCVPWDTNIQNLDEKYSVCNILIQQSGNIVYCLYGQAHTINGGNKLTSFSQVVEAFANEDVKINSVNDKIETSYIIVNNQGTVVANYSNLTQKDNYLFQGDGIVYTATSNNKWHGIVYKFKNPIKGKTIRVEATRVDGIGSKFIRLSWYDSNGVEQLKQFFTGNTAEYVVPGGAVEFDVLLAAAWDGDTYTSGSQCTFNDINIYYKTDDAVSKEDFENLVSGNGEYKYYGINKVNIAFNTYKMVMSILMTRTYNQTPVSYPANYRNIQSIAIFNDIIFGFLQGSAAYIFDFSTKIDLGYMDIPFSSHGNNAQFTDVYYDANDKFPLLLLSRCDSTGKISVLRIMEDDGVYSCSLIKDIVINIAAVKDYGYSACADLNRRKLIISYNTNGNWQVTTNNPTILQEFELPELISETETTYTNTDGKILAINPMYIIQGITYDNGYIYEAAQLRNNNFMERYGLGNIGCIIVFNATSGEICNIIPSNSAEPEGVSIYKNKLYLQAANQQGSGDDIVFWLHEYKF